MGAMHAELARTVDPTHARLAVPALARAITSHDKHRVRSKALHLTSLATSHLLADDIEAGVHAGRRALETARSLKSARVEDQLMRLKQEAEKCHKHRTKELSHRIAARLKLAS
jgi:hypothetical protein